MLSVYLDPFEKAIAFQVTNQSPEITDYIKIRGSFVTSNGWTITSRVAPELDIKNKTIYLRGSDSSKDKRVDRTWDINDNYSRDKYISEVDKALQELVSVFASPSLYSQPSRTLSSGTGNAASNKPLIN